MTSPSDKCHASTNIKTTAVILRGNIKNLVNRKYMNCLTNIDDLFNVNVLIISFIFKVFGVNFAS